MLCSSKLVIQAQNMISDSEDSKGYLSEGEQYRRSRFRPFSKSTSDMNAQNLDKSPISNRLIQEKRSKTTKDIDTQPILKDANSRKRFTRSHNKKTKELGYDTTSESELSDIGKVRSFYFSTLRQDHARKNTSGKNKKHESHISGNCESELLM